MKRFKIFSIAFLLLLTLSSQGFSVSAQEQQTKVATDSLHVRSGPGLSYKITGYLQRDAQVEVIETSNDWLKVKYEGQTGWIASWHTTSSEQSSAQQTEIIAQTDMLNFRQNPSIDAPILARMNTGDKATLISRNEDWVQVQFNGMQGWVFAQYTSEITSTEETKKPKNEEAPNYDKFTVSVDALNVRQEASLSSKKVGMVYKGESYSVQKTDGNWVNIKINDKVVGWVYSFHGELSKKKPSSKQDEKTAAQKITILTNGTNIRTAASTSSEVVTRANAGEQFSIIAEHDNWYEIALTNDSSAFVAKWVVSVDEANPNKQQIDRAPSTLNGLTIVVDPGHGGNDGGTTGARGTAEKTITLKTAELLAEKLKAAGATVHLTRESDHYISLQKRVQTSKANNADAFISIHYDASLNPSVSGFTTFYQHKNQAAIAKSVNDGLASTINLKNRGTQPANYYVLRENKKNAILIELGFLSNPSEESMMNSNNFREQASHGIYKGILNYFNTQE